MKLYIKQKVFSWKDKFFVKDEYGQDSTMSRERRSAGAASSMCTT